MKHISKIIMGVFLLSILTVSAFAADVSLTLSADSGYEGDSITISGTYDSDQWITVKVIDSDGNIVFIQPILSANNGSFSTEFLVPSIDAGTLTIITGAGSDVAVADFTVKVKSHSHSSGKHKNNDNEEKKEAEDIDIINSEGEKIDGKVEKTENGYDITIDGEKFGNTKNASVKITTGSFAVSFNETATKHISDVAGLGKIVLSIENADTSALSSETQKLIGDRPVYDITLLTGDTQISDFGGTATITVPYEITDGEDSNAIVVYYVDDEGNLETVRGRYDGKTGTVKFMVTHFSRYAVGYNKVSFDDVSVPNWFYDAVTFCAAREITTGTGNNLFSPDATLTRGQFIVMLMRAYGIKADQEITDNFDDAGNIYYTGYLATAKRLKITNGVGNNMFLPNSAITRQDMFTLLYRALDVLGQLPKTENAKALSDFSDTDNISDYAKDAMETFIAAGIVSGNGDKLAPCEYSTRAQMAQVLYNLLKAN